MQARQLFQAGKLDEAIEALGAEVRDNPTDAQRRAFLFELLCFAGKFDRAEKQLDVLGTRKCEAEMGALLYHAALHAERLRQDMFEKESFPHRDARSRRRHAERTSPSRRITDADPRIGPRLELFAAGQYTWLPFEHIDIRSHRGAQAPARPALGAGDRSPRRDRSRVWRWAKR